MIDPETLFQLLASSVLLTSASGALVLLLNRSQNPVLRYRLSVLWVSFALLTPVLLVAARYLQLPRFATAALRAQTALTISSDAPNLPARIEWSTLLLCLWALGFLFQMVVLVVAGIRLKRVNESSAPLTGCAEAMFERCRSLVAPNPRTSAGSANITVPFVSGILRPKILVPTKLVQNENGQLELVLLHELTHVRRHDALARLAAALAQAIFFFNPMVHRICRDLSRDCELLCDQEVLELSDQPAQYAQLLVNLAEAAHRSKYWPVPALASSELFLKRRILQILERRPIMKYRSKHVRLITLLFGLLLLTSILAIGSATFEGLPQTESQKSDEVPPKLVKKVNPVYPEEAKKEGIEGTVNLEVKIDTDGKTYDIQVLEGHSLLAQAATEAVSQWEFSPGLKDGKPVRVIAHITVNFTLAKDKKSVTAKPGLMPPPRHDHHGHHDDGHHDHRHHAHDGHSSGHDRHLAPPPPPPPPPQEPLR